jgi:predicted kinase
MPATSQQQQKLFGLALSVKRGETPRSEVSDEVLQIVDTMSEKKIKDFAETSHKGLPTKVETVLRGLVRETFRNKVLGESSRRSEDFFEEYKFGVELHKLFKGKFDGKKFDKFIDALEDKTSLPQYDRIISRMGNMVGMNVRSYDNKPTHVYLNDLKKEIEKLYKIHNESVNETFIPKVGTIDKFELKNLLMKNSKVNAVLGDSETAFMKKPDVVVIMHQSKRFNTIFTDGKQEFEIDMKVGKLVKPLSKARKEIVAHFSKNESVNENSLLEARIRMILEGVDDPGILKCVFMAGGPGSGKSFVANDIFGVGGGLSTTAASGLKIVASDVAFEAALKKNGINPKDLATIEKENPELWNDIVTNPDSIRNKAKELTDKQQKLYETGRLGMIVDGTGHNYSKISNHKKHAESLGYDTYMVFVNTSLEVALERNKKRSRTLPEDVVKESWKSVQENLGKFQQLFGNNFKIVDNTVYKPIDKSIQKAVSAFIKQPTRNRIGKEWIQKARLLKKVNLIK